MSYIGQRLKAARKAAGLTQSEVARRLGMARTTIVAIEQGKRRISTLELPAVANAYGVKVETLTDESAASSDALRTAGGIHIYMGFARRKAEKGERCFHCGAKEREYAHTYFGAPVCGGCWDAWWRQTEDGETDPPFAEIKNQSAGFWL